MPQSHAAPAGLGLGCRAQPPSHPGEPPSSPATGCCLPARQHPRSLCPTLQWHVAPPKQHPGWRNRAWSKQEGSTLATDHIPTPAVPPAGSCWPSSTGIWFTPLQMQPLVTTPTPARSTTFSVMALRCQDSL